MEFGGKEKKLCGRLAKVGMFVKDFLGGKIFVNLHFRRDEELF